MKVYWTTLAEPKIKDFILGIRPPHRVITSIEGKIKDSFYSGCVAFTEHSKNQFVITSPLDYTLNIYPKEKRWESPDNGHIENWMLLHDLEHSLIQFKTGIVMFSEESVNISTMQPYLHHTDFTAAGNVLYGKYDISKWIRPLHTAIYLKQQDQYTFKITQNTPLMYVQFDTAEKVELEYISSTDEIEQTIRKCVTLKETRKRIFSLKECYKQFEAHRMRRRLMNEVKKQERYNK